MSSVKMVVLVLYGVLAVLALALNGTAVGNVSAWALVLLAAIHAVECVVFFTLVKRVGGSLPGQILNLFLFGIIHANEVKKALADGAENP